MNEFLDFDQAVDYLKTTPSTLYKWLQAGKVPGHKLGRQWRFLRDELDLHVSGAGARLQINRDILTLTQLLETRIKKTEGTMESRPTDITEKIIWDAFDHGAKLIHFHPSKGKYAISFRTRNGMDELTTIMEETFKDIDSTIVRQSSAIENDPELRRFHLHRGSDESIQVKYQKIETVAGARLTLHLFQPEKDVLPIEKISGDENVRSQFRGFLKRSSGLIIVSGASGSGKTTTVYSLLNELKNQGRVVFTLEERVDLVVEGINQIEFKSKDSQQFANTFEKLFGSDPDVICLGLGSYFGWESSVFAAACRAASTGHLVVLQMDHSTVEEAVAAFKSQAQYPVDRLHIMASCQRLVSDQKGLRAVYEFFDSRNN